MQSLSPKEIETKVCGMITNNPEKVTGGNQLWREGVIDGFRYCAKVYDRPSRFGINDGRVSKLTITRNGNNWDQATFNYDRGLDFDFGPASVVEKILNLYK